MAPAFKPGQSTSPTCHDAHRGRPEWLRAAPSQTGDPGLTEHESTNDPGPRGHATQADSVAQKPLVDSDSETPPPAPGKQRPEARRRAPDLQLMALGAAVLLIAAFGSWLVVRITASGIRLSPDSFSYLGIAHSLTTGRGYAFGFGIPGLPAETSFAPLYPTELAVSDLVHVGPMRWAAWLNAAAFAVLIVLMAAAVYDLTRSSIAAVFAAAMTCTSRFLLYIYQMAWSEPTFFVWEAWSLWMLARYASTQRKRDLYLGAVATGLATLTRYAGASLLLFGLVVVVLAGRRALMERLRDAAGFLLVAGVPIGAWLLRNHIVGGSTTGRSVAYYAVGSRRWHGVHETVGAWLSTLRLPGPVGDWWLLPLLVVVIIVLCNPPRVRAALRTRAGLAIAVMFGFLPAYGAFLVISVSSAAPGVHFNNRILSPALIPIIIGLTLTCWVLYRATPYRWLAYAVWGAAAVIAAGNSARVARVEARSMVAAPPPFTARWPASPLVNHVKTLPRGTIIYSNFAGQLFVTTGRNVYQLPDPQLPAGAGRNPDYPTQIRDLRRQLQHHDVMVAEFAGRLSRRLARRGRWPTPQDLCRALGLRIVAQHRGDGLLVERDTAAPKQSC